MQDSHATFEDVDQNAGGLKTFLKRSSVLVAMVQKLKLITKRFDINCVACNANMSLFGSKRSGQALFLPYGGFLQAHFIQLALLQRGYDSHMGKKYTMSGFDVQNEDIIVDCGGFVGGWTMAALKAGAGESYYVEPTPHSRDCGIMNFQLHGIADRVTVIAAGLGQTKGKAWLNVSSTGADNSLLDPDEWATGSSIEVDITTFDALVETHDLDPSKIFFKVEAEGFEVEVVKGMQSYRAGKIVVDVGPERNGQSPREEIEALLKEKGYSQVAHTRKCLFARL